MVFFQNCMCNKYHDRRYVIWKRFFPQLMSILCRGIWIEETINEIKIEETIAEEESKIGEKTSKCQKNQAQSLLIILLFLFDHDKWRLSKNKYDYVEGAHSPFILIKQNLIWFLFLFTKFSGENFSVECNSRKIKNSTLSSIVLEKSMFDLSNKYSSSRLHIYTWKFPRCIAWIIPSVLCLTFRPFSPLCLFSRSLSIFSPCAERGCGCFNYKSTVLLVFFSALWIISVSLFEFYKTFSIPIRFFSKQKNSIYQLGEKSFKTRFFIIVERNNQRISRSHRMTVGYSKIIIWSLDISTWILVTHSMGNESICWGIWFCDKIVNPWTTHSLSGFSGLSGP